jgi:hypothetical protein
MIKVIYYLDKTGDALLRLEMTEGESRAYDAMSKAERVQFIRKNLTEDEKREISSGIYLPDTYMETFGTRGTCQVCGCTPYDACTHPDYGNCWWANEDEALCSHCADETLANDPATKRPSCVRRAVF